MDDYRTIDEIGNQYGSLVVISRTTSEKSGTGAWWLCQCECGKQKAVRGVYLRAGNTISCGCRAKLSVGQASFNNLYGITKRAAKKRNKKWSLTKDQFLMLTKQSCAYCGVGPKQRFGRPNLNGYYFYNGLDRTDSSLGYTIDNVVPCCEKCNWGKNVMTTEKFALHIKRMYIYQNG